MCYRVTVRDTASQLLPVSGNDTDQRAFPRAVTDAFPFFKVTVFHFFPFRRMVAFPDAFATSY